MDLSLLEKVRSLACKAWKMLRQLGLWIKSLAPLLDGAVPKRDFGAVPRRHIHGATGDLGCEAVWQHRNGLDHVLGTRIWELLIGLGIEKQQWGWIHPIQGKMKGERVWRDLEVS